MPILRATVKLNKQTGIPEDAVVNVLHFSVADDPEGAAIDLSFNVAAFYVDLQAYFSPALDASAGAHLIQWAEITPGGAGPDDDISSAVIREDTFTMGAVGDLTTTLPDEVAACLSLVGAGAASVPEESGATRPRSRHRGRIYLGPLGRNCGTQSGVGEFRTATAFRSEVLTSAATNLHDGAEANDATWVVYSRQNAATYAVESIWMDDAFDTVRSRGLAPTLRSTHVF